MTDEATLEVPKHKVLSPAKIGLVNNPQQHIPQVVIRDVDLRGIGKLKFETLSDKPVSLDHVKAVEYCDLPVFPGEREVVDSHVQFLYDEMRKGTFNEKLVILSTALCGDTVYKINGQHTAWAVLFMPPSFSLEVREIHYKVSSRDQLKLLYSTYDRLRARSDSHVAKVFLIDTPVAEGIYASLLSKLSQGLKYWFLDSEAERRRTSPEQVAALAQREFPAVFRAVGLFAQDHMNSCAFATRQPVLAAMFATFHKTAQKSPEFWKPVLDGLGLTEVKDARWKLRTFLLESAGVKVRKHGGHSRGRRDRFDATTEETYRMCVHAWNRWRKGEAVELLKPPGTRVRPQ